MGNQELSSRHIVVFLRDFLGRACVDVQDIEASLDSESGIEREIYNIITSDSAVLIGGNGDTLRAIENLIRDLLRKQGLGDKHISIDINNYRKKRRALLEEEVRNCIETVRSTKESIELPPMSSYERLVVHNLVTHESGVNSVSAGVGRDRRVSIVFDDSIR